ncbi:MAG: hypothetical protein B7Z72_10085 [Gemmatimonadetes bacterium 21-71-4]|nr:MAG: hypothetical protein B7Z72_10085 [Gemmatimonadetes bacterium 21-71-4]
MLGIKPPRYRSLWDAVVNSVAFQQVSLHAATAVVRRMIMTRGVPDMSSRKSPACGAPIDVDAALAELAPPQGMPYLHLLPAGLDARGGAGPGLRGKR